VAGPGLDSSQLNDARESELGSESLDSAMI
jgi:hypothetical protein